VDEVTERLGLDFEAGVGVVAAALDTPLKVNTDQVVDAENNVADNRDPDD